MKQLIVGVDPSSRLIASVFTRYGTSDKPRRSLIQLPPKEPQRTSRLAYTGFRALLLKASMNVDEVHVFIEMPTLVGRAGAGALIPQAQVNGALLAAAYDLEKVRSLELVPIGKWKKDVLGNGGANKKLVAAWAKQYWRTAYDLADGSQDLIDAAAINRYGEQFVSHINKMTKE